MDIRLSHELRERGIACGKRMGLTFSRWCEEVWGVWLSGALPVQEDLQTFLFSTRKESSSFDFPWLSGADPKEVKRALACGVLVAERNNALRDGTLEEQQAWAAGMRSIEDQRERLNARRRELGVA